MNLWKWRLYNCKVIAGKILVQPDIMDLYNRILSK
jgi:hypothetical protein